MKPPPGPSLPPKMPIAVSCSCGQKIVLEPRWLGKATGCSACGRNFTVRMLFDPQTRRWTPHVNFLPAAPATPAKAAPPGTWVSVACRCGHKIGLDSRFAGRNMTCKSCHRFFTIRMVKGDAGSETAVIRYAREAPPAPPPAAPAPAKPVDPRRKAETARGRTVPKEDQTGSKMIDPPPGEMHLLCICGEELTVDKKYYNDKLCCGGCGTVMQLRLIFVPDREKYELEARVVDPKAE